MANRRERFVHILAKDCPVIAGNGKAWQPGPFQDAPVEQIGDLSNAATGYDRCEATEVVGRRLLGLTVSQS